ALRDTQDTGAQSLPVHFQPIRRRSMRRGIACAENRGIVPALLSHLNHIVWLYLKGRDIDLAAIHLDVAVPHDLARLGAARAKAHPVDDVVQPALQHIEHRLARDALFLSGFLKEIAELPFKQPIVPAGLLLLAQLQAVAYDLRPAALP